MNILRALLFLFPLLCVGGLSAQDAKTIHAYAVGDWRNGPVVTISPLFETTEALTTPQLIAHVKAAYPEFKAITDITVHRFVTTEEGDESRRDLERKYHARNLEVRMLQAPPPPPANVPEGH